MSLKKLKKKNNLKKEKETFRQLESIPTKDSKEIEKNLEESTSINFIAQFLVWLTNYYDLRAQEKRANVRELKYNQIKYTNIVLDEFSFPKQIDWIRKMTKFTEEFLETRTKEQKVEFYSVSKNKKMNVYMWELVQVFKSSIKAAIFDFTKDIFFKNNTSKEDRVRIYKINGLIELTAMIFNLKGALKDSKNNEYFLKMFSKNELKYFRNLATQGTNIFYKMLYHITGDRMEINQMDLKIQEHIEGFLNTV